MRLLAVPLMAGLGALHVHAAYSGLLLLASKLLPPKKRKNAGAQPRIAAIVAARDEEAVIERSVRSLLAQTYPRDRFEVFVVADRCKDRTAQKARAAGATVLERDAGASTGKSAALNWALRSEALRSHFDAVAIFDADNVVHEYFLSAVGARLSAEEPVVQGYVDCANPTRSWVAASSALGFYSIAAVAQAPREALGLSVPLMGTGWAAMLPTVLDLFPKLESLADDLELSCLLACRGVRVAFEPSARVADEKPVRLGVAVLQRERWLQGRWAVCVRHVPRLLAVACSRRAEEPGARWSVRLRAVDVAIQMMTPSLLFSAVAMGAGGASMFAVASAATSRTLHALSIVSLAASGVYYALPALAISALSPPKKIWLFYAIQPAYLLLSLPLSVSAFVKRSSTVWRRTQHGDGT